MPSVGIPSDSAPTFPAEIVRIAARGDGVTADGRHVALAAPGDSIDATGRITRGPHRAEPPCRHFPLCGACQLQHVDEDGLRKYLADRIAGALRAQRLPVPDILSPQLSPPFTRRRASLKAERRGKTVLLGFHAGGSHRIVDIETCHVLVPELFALLPRLRELLAVLLPDRRGCGVVLTLADQGADILLSGIEAHGLAAHDALVEFAGAGGIARLAVDSGEGPEDRWAPDPVTITLGDVAVPLPHNAFLQATADGEAALRQNATDAIGAATAVADLFAGIGTFALPIAVDGRKVTAVEGRADALAALRLAAHRRMLPVMADHRDLYRRPMTPADLTDFDAVILDPPRSGAEAQVRQLSESAVPVIVYVSCNPATFARDASILAGGGYRIDWIQPVGQFRWSTHVELVARLSR